NLVRATPEHFRTIEGRQMLTLGGPPLPVASLAETLGLPTQAREGGKVPVLIVAAAEKRMAFIIDEFLTEQEIVIKGLGARIRRLAHISGATILPSGKIALVLNAANLIRTAQARAPVLAAPAPQGETRREGEGGKKRILIAEDSVTTRTLEKSILEAAGYDVTVAVDGADAWQTLQEHGTDLLVSDVDMPRMDGFALAEAVRQSKRFQDLPIVLVTSRQSEQDKARGIEVEADAYLVKSAFDQKNLLEAIAQLI
ncbi:MAG: response regulator, partial [Planctomycetes bacterium]|nr:response regulator [Planctomycetota bacterium]